MTARPDIDRLIERLSENGSTDDQYDMVARIVAALLPSIRDYVKELEEFYADALKGIRDGEADQVRIERLREALEHVVDETRNPWAIARDALAADKEAGDG